MGILIITCPNCSTSFRMDPDDPKTYLSGNFDLTPHKNPPRYKIPFLDSLSSYFRSHKDIRFLIPLFLFLILLLNIIKIYNTPTEPSKEEKESEEFFQDPETDPTPKPETRPPGSEPSVEI